MKKINQNKRCKIETKNRERERERDEKEKRKIKEKTNCRADYITVDLLKGNESLVREKQKCPSKQIKKNKKNGGRE